MRAHLGRRWMLGCVGFMLLGLAPVISQSKSDEPEQLLSGRISEAILNRRWQEAFELSVELQRLFPDSSKRGQAVFYQAWAAEELGEMSRALRLYEGLIKSPYGAGETLLSDAQLRIVNLSVELARAGDRSYLDRAWKGLKSRRKEVRYYSALRLSYVDDRADSSKAVPVLRSILDDESDDELTNRALLALMRIDPRLVEGRQRNDRGRRGRILRVEVVADDEVFTLRFPISLARLLFDAIPDDAVREMKKRGIDARNLVDELESLSGTRFLEIRSKEGLFRISIE